MHQKPRHERKLTGSVDTAVSRAQGQDQLKTSPVLPLSLKSTTCSICFQKKEVFELHIHRPRSFSSWRFLKLASKRTACWVPGLEPDELVSPTTTTCEPGLRLTSEAKEMLEQFKEPSSGGSYILQKLAERSRYALNFIGFTQRQHKGESPESATVKWDTRA